MISEKELLCANKRIAALKKKIERKNNIEKNLANANKLKTQIIAINAWSKNINYIEKEFDLVFSQDLKNQITNSIEDAVKIIQDESFNELEINSLSETCLKWNKAIQNEWKKFYSEKSEPTINVLELLNDFDQNHILELKNKIKDGEKITLDTANIGLFKKALDDSNTLINEMELDDSIKKFLTKINTGKGTLNDVNSEIMKWVLLKGLGTKIKLSFVK